MDENRGDIAATTLATRQRLLLEHIDIVTRRLDRLHTIISGGNQNLSDDVAVADNQSVSNKKPSPLSSVFPACPPWGVDTHPPAHADLIEHLSALCRRVGFSDFEFARVRSDYYELDLAERARILHCGTDELCKSVIMRNVRGDNGTASAAPPLILVVVQYTARLHKERLNKAVHALAPTSNKKSLNYRLADESDGVDLSGYGHNSITPIGMRTALPMIVSHRIVQRSSIWLGGGHVDIKWRVRTDELVSAFSASVADITYET